MFNVPQCSLKSLLFFCCICSRVNRSYPVSAVLATILPFVSFVRHSIPPKGSGTSKDNLLQHRFKCDGSTLVLYTCSLMNSNCPNYNSLSTLHAKGHTSRWRVSTYMSCDSETACFPANCVEPMHLDSLQEDGMRLMEP